MKSVYVKTLGCKVNTFDSHALENQFKALGYHLADSAADADITILNTCSVTANADREARSQLRRMRRENADALVIATGCYAQTDSAKLAAMPEVDLVIPNESKELLTDLVARHQTRKEMHTSVPSKLPQGVKLVSENKQSHFKSSLTLFDRAQSTQTRAFLKIQDGCNGFCTYCLIPYARGASRSVPHDQVIDEVRRLIAEGTREIVFTGIHIGDYGGDIHEANAAQQTLATGVIAAPFIGDSKHFVALLKDVFALPGLGRIRISSLEPMEMTRELLEILAANAEHVCDHFHLPLQSGSDRILGLMRRAYNKAEYRAMVQMTRRFFPEACIGADVIPGFPSETDSEFDETAAFIKELDLAYLHVFPYSARPNTAAMRMPGHLHGEIIKARAKQLRDLSQAQWDLYARRFLGQSRLVLWENDIDTQGRRLGITGNYLKVAGLASVPQAPGSMHMAKFKGFVEDQRLLAVIH